MNVFTFTGNLGKDAEQRYTPDNNSVVSFSVAVKSGFGQKEKTSWVKCSIWGKRGEGVFPYLKKGSLVGVSGEFVLADWTDKDGATRVSAEVRVNEVTLLGGKPSDNRVAEKPANEQSRQGASRATAGDFEDDIPF